jgi:hypothetical protein
MITDFVVFKNKHVFVIEITKCLHYCIKCMLILILLNQCLTQTESLPESLVCMFSHICRQPQHSVQGILFLKQEHLFWEQSPLQLHLMNSRTAMGAGSRLIQSIWMSVPVTIQPWPLGLGMSGSGWREHSKCKPGSLLVLYVWVEHPYKEEGSCFVGFWYRKFYT